ncbi:MAG: MFS transporter [Chloroflexi bacterium]|nr:MFS transporter [Chloroflexota bacterium]MBU1748498.1 MFS transporter [Chloroflexota bacterium]
MKRALRWYDYITINIYWFALTTRSQVLTPLIIPLLVQQFVGDEVKGTYVGIIRLWALMAAVLIQALMGLLSDRSMLRWGRRRPFIVAGTLGEIVVFVLIGFTASLDGMSGYWILFGLYVLSMLSSNTAHAATQGLIPDLVPEDKRGRFSGVKALLELPLPLVFVSFVVARMVSAGNLWGALFALIVVLIVCMLVSLFIPETPLEKVPFALNWNPFLRLVVMTGAFTVVILGMGWIVNAVMQLPLEAYSTARIVLTGLAGLVGMTIAVALGVWVSIRISIGRTIRENPSFTWWVITRLAFLVASTNLAGFVLYFIQERFPDLQGEKAAGPTSIVVMLVGVFVLLTALPSGWLADRFGKKPLLVVSGLAGALGTFIVVGSPDLLVINVGACLIGAAVGLFYSANWALGTDLVPQDQAGRYLGLSNLAGAGAGAIGAYIGGPIADSLGYTLLFVIYGLLFLLSVVTLIPIQEKR